MRLRGPVMAIVWEQWRSVRAPFAMAIWTGLAAIGLFHPRGYGQTRLAGTDDVDSMLVVFVLVMLGVFVLTDTDSLERLGLRVPVRQWRLPVRRGWFLAIYIVVRLGIVGTVAATLGQYLVLAGGGIHRLLLPRPVEWLTALSVVGVASLFAVEAVVTRWKRADAGAVSMFATWAILWTVVLGVVLAYGPSRLLVPEFLLTASVAASAACTAVAVAAALRFDRPAVFDRVFSRRSTKDIASYWPGRLKGPVEAQSWYEWTRHGMLLPVLTVGGLVVLVAGAVARPWYGALLGNGTPVGTDPLYYRFASALIVAGWLALPFTAFLAGLVRLSHEWNEFRSGKTPYARLMPIPVATASSLRLGTSFRSLGLTLCLPAVCSVGGLAIMIASGRTIGTPPPGIVLLFAGIGFLAAFVVTWSLYWLAVPLFLYGLWWALVMGVAMSTTGSLSTGLVPRDDAIAFVTVLPAFVVIGLTFMLAWKVRARHALTPTATGAIVAACYPWMVLPRLYMIYNPERPGTAPSLIAAFLTKFTPETILGRLAALIGLVLVVTASVWLLVSFLKRRWGRARTGSFGNSLRRMAPSSDFYLALWVIVCVIHQGTIAWRSGLNGFHIRVSGPEEDVAVEVALAYLPAFAGFLQAYWTDRLRTR